MGREDSMVKFLFVEWGRCSEFLQFVGEFVGEVAGNVA